MSWHGLFLYALLAVLPSAGAADWGSFDLSSAREALLAGIAEGPGASGYAAVSETLLKGPYDASAPDYRKRLDLTRAANNVRQLHTFWLKGGVSPDVLETEIEHALSVLDPDGNRADVRAKACRLYGIAAPKRLRCD